MFGMTGSGNGNGAAIGAILFLRILRILEISWHCSSKSVSISALIKAYAVSRRVHARCRIILSTEMEEKLKV